MCEIFKDKMEKKHKNKEVMYYGPITFLMVNPQLLSNYTTSYNLSQVTIYIFTFFMKQLVYLHYTRIAGMQVKRKVPAFKSWNSNLMKKKRHLK